MRDKTHNEQVERWARYVKENPDNWKSQLKPFIDAQIIMARRFYSKLAKTPEGLEKIKRLRNLV
jgi:hypothetical protein